MGAESIFESFVWDAWYVGALSTEASRKPLGRTLLGRPLVLFRTEAGAPVALEDRCCHRHAPLHPGELLGDEIECPYHGLRFAPDGRCTFIPGQAHVPRTARVRAYPTAERHGFVWVFMGAPERADEAAIPDFRWLDSPDWTVRHLHMPMRCSYVLGIDNLMDLSHIAYTHRTTIGNRADAEDAQIETFADADRVTVRRWVLKTPPARVYVEKTGSSEPIDRWQVIEYQAPATIRTFKGGAPGIHGREGFDFRGADDEAPASANVSRGCTVITPETATSLHYFTGHAHLVRPEEASWIDDVWRTTIETLEQDRDILELTQRNMQLHPGEREVLIHFDAGPNRARRLLQRRLSAEAGAPASLADTEAAA